MRKSHLSAVLQTIVLTFGSFARQYLRDLSIHIIRMPLYTSKIYAVFGFLDNMWAFVDGTMRKTYRLAYFQMCAYSGHERCHGLTFQSVMTPYGMLVYVGP